MSTTVELPNGQTAVLKDDAELTNKQVRHLRNSALIAAGVASKIRDLGKIDEDPSTWATLAELDTDDLDRIEVFQRECVLARRESWTLDRDLPATEDDVDNLPRPIYVPLTVAAADINWTDDFSPAGAQDPKAVTASS